MLLTKLALAHNERGIIRIVYFVKGNHVSNRLLKSGLIVSCMTFLSRRLGTP